MVHLSVVRIMLTMYAFLLVIGFAKLHAQIQTPWPHTKSPWIIGIGINAIEDDGKLFPPIVKNTWNFIPFISRISISKNLKKNFSVEGVASYSQYQAGKKINSAINQTTKNYFALDVLIKYDLDRFFGGTKWVDPFIMFGPGSVFVNPVKHEVNADAQPHYAIFGDVGGGMNSWINNRFGFTVQAVAKVVAAKSVSSHFQYSFGCFYKLGAAGTKWKEEPFLNTKQDENSLAAKIENDSALEIAYRAIRSSLESNTAEQSALILEAEITKYNSYNNQRLQMMEKVAENLLDILPEHKQGECIIDEKLIHGYVKIISFATNSSALKPEDKNTLDGVVDVLKFSTLNLEIKGFMNNVGASAWNMQLSKKRVATITNYMVSKGINANRLIVKKMREERNQNEKIQPMIHEVPNRNVILKAVVN